MYHLHIFKKMTLIEDSKQTDTNLNKKIVDYTLVVESLSIKKIQKCKRRVRLEKYIHAPRQKWSLLCKDDVTHSFSDAAGITPMIDWRCLSRERGHKSFQKWRKIDKKREDLTLKCHSSCLLWAQDVNPLNISCVLLWNEMFLRMLQLKHQRINKHGTNSVWY